MLHKGASPHRKKCKYAAYTLRIRSVFAAYTLRIRSRFALASTVSTALPLEHWKSQKIIGDSTERLALISGLPI